MSVKFYNENAVDFFENTVDADMGETYKIFNSYLKKGDTILDLGCGSGRDSHYFSNYGYEVISADYSDEMVKMAGDYLNKEVIKLDMRQMDFKQKFDGIWACASILHIKKDEMAKVLEKSHKALKDGGIMYMSFKYGEGEVQRGGRHFSNYTEDTFSKLLDSLDIFSVEKFWKTADVRPDRGDEFWLNVIVKKK
ncbi:MULTISPECIES: class I SAM-dependent methyltransferase [Psychrilyobacter]|uniref:Methyltransferase domain-containing protein n=1 Tax=Psychrilyobacter piezotolerans TaxID=2293438 RepID=A0ABX9KIR4_9FUSO|nr:MULTISPECIES: class I SAM-dependent methyltransferase [Psychrilyobacter]MCS5420624.1 class I SAM-dependent methyltransferase [Psychrilyobacter sp. S5]NDI77357.1 class I SAM-dependent methyltransferase [Psychrilyobacter piezotolerans]RDE63664.1 class I SAM-dependent methyltransferase [Psychrilyobacter sp. S5]REI42008.1 methyltransferase domain-containing protein [Psychrilyobacter piezotolerans]